MEQISLDFFYWMMIQMNYHQMRQVMVRKYLSQMLVEQGMVQLNKKNDTSEMVRYNLPFSLVSAGIDCVITSG